MPTSLTRLSSCLSSILSAMECPVCFEVPPPPVHQCPLGHIICAKCFTYTEKCPICRTKFDKDRSLLADQIYSSLMDAFQLKHSSGELRSKKLWERLFGKKKRQKTDSSSSGSPEIKNKFLSRLIGKASSVDNLASNSKLCKAEREMNFPLRKKSLSSNELFHSGVSRSKLFLNSSNFSSCQSSLDSLGGGNPLLHELNSKAMSATFFRCPCSRSCDHLSTVADMMSHIQHRHDGPILQYYKMEFILNFPLSFADLAVITMYCYDKLFFIKIIPDDAGNIRVHIWLLGSGVDAASFKAIVAIFSTDDEQNTELTFKTFVCPLQTSDSTPFDVYKDQIIITKSTVDAYFSNKSFSLNVSIVNVT